MTEGALRWHAGSPRLMEEQLTHLAEQSHQPNVTLGVIPWTRPVAIFPGHEFHIYDYRLVIASIETALATITDLADIATYTDLFSQLEELADTGDAARRTIARIAADYQTLGR